MFLLLFLPLFGLVLLICLPIWIIQEIARDKSMEEEKKRQKRWHEERRFQKQSNMTRKRDNIL